jgi:uncharacterized protein YjaG (DUF416 family)
VVHRFDPIALKRRLEGLQSRARLAFGALLLDRAVPNFLQFEAETGAAGGAMLRGAQAKVWGLLEGNNAVAPFLGVTARSCEFFAPDTEQYASLYTSSALDAVTIACNVLDYVNSDRVDLLLDSASLRRDSIDVFLQLAEGIDASGSDFEMRLLTHSLMQEELGFQEADLTFLKEWQSKGDQAWHLVLKRSIDNGYSTLRMLPSR